MAYKKPISEYCKPPAFQAAVDPDSPDLTRFAGLDIKLAHTSRIAKTHPHWLPGTPYPIPEDEPFASTLRDRLIDIGGDSAQIEDRSYRTPGYLSEPCVLLYGDCVLHARLGTEQYDVSAFSICACNPGTKRFRGYALDVYGTWHPHEAAVIVSDGPEPGYLLIDTLIDRHAAYYGLIEDFVLTF